MPLVRALLRLWHVLLLPPSEFCIKSSLDFFKRQFFYRVHAVLTAAGPRGRKLHSCRTGGIATCPKRKYTAENPIQTLLGTSDTRHTFSRNRDRSIAMLPSELDGDRVMLRRVGLQKPPVRCAVRLGSCSYSASLYPSNAQCRFPARLKRRRCPRVESLLL